jgi:Domain of unknown function (DUF4190)/Septum formation
MWVSDESGTPVSLPAYPSVMHPSFVYDSPAASTTSGWAIASLVLGILGGVVWGTICGVVALGKIRDTGQKGRGMAIAGIILSGLWVVVVVVVVAVAALHGRFTNLSQPTSTPDGRAGSGVIDVHDLAVGDCFGWPHGSVSSVALIPCGQAHDAQVFAVWALSGSSYPGYNKAVQIETQGCLARRESLTAASSPLEISDFGLTQANWAFGDRFVDCVIISPTPNLRSSLLSANHGQPTSTPGARAGAVNVWALGLVVDDCIDWPSSGSQPIESVPLMPCGQAHNAQVFAMFELSGSSYPGDDAVASAADQGCADREASLSAAASSMQISYLRPGQADWAIGDRGVTCVAFDPTPDLTSSILTP